MTRRHPVREKPKPHRVGGREWRDGVKEKWGGYSQCDILSFHHLHFFLSIPQKNLNCLFCVRTYVLIVLFLFVLMTSYVCVQLLFLWMGCKQGRVNWLNVLKYESCYLCVPHQLPHCLYCVFLWTKTWGLALSHSLLAFWARCVCAKSLPLKWCCLRERKWEVTG